MERLAWIKPVDVIKPVAGVLELWVDFIGTCEDPSHCSGSLLEDTILSGDLSIIPANTVIGLARISGGTKREQTKAAATIVMVTSARFRNGVRLSGLRAGT